MGYTPFYQIDGLALDSRDEYLYYQALQGRKLYRIPTRALIDESLSEENLENAIEFLIAPVPTEGMIMDEANNLYLTSFTDHFIKYFAPRGQLTALIQDPRIVWPGNFSFDGQGNLYFTISQMHKMPTYNGGKRQIPFQVSRIKKSALQMR